MTVSIRASLFRAAASAEADVKMFDGALERFFDDESDPRTLNLFGHGANRRAIDLADRLATMPRDIVSRSVSVRARRERRRGAGSSLFAHASLPVPRCV